MSFIVMLVRILLMVWLVRFAMFSEISTVFSHSWQCIKGSLFVVRCFARVKISWWYLGFDCLSAWRSPVCSAILSRNCVKPIFLL